MFQVKKNVREYLWGEQESNISKSKSKNYKRTLKIANGSRLPISGRTPVYERGFGYFTGAMKIRLQDHRPVHRKSRYNLKTKTEMTAMCKYIKYFRLYNGTEEHGDDTPLNQDTIIKKTACFVHSQKEMTKGSLLKLSISPNMN